MFLIIFASIALLGIILNVIPISLNSAVSYNTSALGLSTIPLVDPVISFRSKLPPTPGILFNSVVCNEATVEVKLPFISVNLFPIIAKLPPAAPAIAALPRALNCLPFHVCWRSLPKSWGIGNTIPATDPPSGVAISFCLKSVDIL